MNGVHDMGGQHGLGAIVPEPEGNPFHAEWEARTHAMVIARYVAPGINSR